MIKKIGLALLVIVFGFAITLWIISEPRPAGKRGADADAMAEKMLSALNSEAYDSIGAIKWNFKGIHDYVWDKKNDKADVMWEDLKVVLDLNNNTGTVYKAGQEKSNEGEVAKAFEYFYNDSFWLVAPYKVFDDGTERSMVETEEGPALLITYNKGGVTPGDSYLWFLDRNYLPRKYKMWVKIIPVGGLEFTWTDWKQYQGGVWLPGNHEGFINIEMNDIATASDASDLRQ